MKLISIILLVIIPLCSNSQTIDTSTLFKIIKLNMLSDFDLGPLSEVALTDYVNRPLNLIPLKSKGFSHDILFYKIEEQILAVDTNKLKAEVVMYKTPTCLRLYGCYYICGVNLKTGEVYKLKGTRQNDFIILYNELQWRLYLKKPYKINKRMVKIFANNYSVDSLDLQCLLLSLRKKMGDCLDTYTNRMIVN